MIIWLWEMKSLQMVIIWKTCSLITNTEDLCLSISIYKLYTLSYWPLSLSKDNSLFKSSYFLYFLILLYHSARVHLYYTKWLLFNHKYLVFVLFHICRQLSSIVLAQIKIIPKAFICICPLIANRQIILCLLMIGLWTW